MCWGVAFILIPPNIVKLYHSFIFTYPEKFMCLAWVVKKVEFVVAPFVGDPLILVLPNFVKFYLFFMYTYLNIFMCPA